MCIFYWYQGLLPFALCRASSISTAWTNRKQQITTTFSGMIIFHTHTSKEWGSFPYCCRKTSVNCIKLHISLAAAFSAPLINAMGFSRLLMNSDDRWVVIFISSCERVGTKEYWMFSLKMEIDFTDAFNWQWKARLTGTKNTWTFL